MPGSVPMPLPERTNQVSSSSSCGALVGSNQTLYRILDAAQRIAELPHGEGQDRCPDRHQRQQLLEHAAPDEVDSKPDGEHDHGDADALSRMISPATSPMITANGMKPSLKVPTRRPRAHRHAAT